MKTVLLALVCIALCVWWMFPQVENIPIELNNSTIVEDCGGNKSPHIVLEKVEIPTTENVTVNITNETHVPVPVLFDVAISFGKMNGSNHSIIVELPDFVINDTPVIACSGNEYSPFLVLPGNISAYFFECACLDRAIVMFGNYTIPFCVLEDGNGWNFNHMYSTGV